MPESGTDKDTDMAEPTSTISLRERLLKERHALLDLSTRNRLLNTPLRTRNNRAIEIVDEKSAEIFRILADGKAMTFLPGSETDADGGDFVPQPGADGRHTDLKLQTRLASESLQKRLFDVWYDAQTLEQEQGVNILYLALGLLRWYDDNDAETPRHAPLVLLPVQLERSSAADRFKLRGRDEPPSPNLTLQAKMKSEFGLVIPDFPQSADNEDEIDLAVYAASVAETVRGQKRWEVLPDAVVLGFFSFSKFLMYRDLDPDTWPEETLLDNPLIAALLRDGFAPSDPLIGDSERIDDVLEPDEMRHVVDADSSQSVAIAEVVAGRTLVIKGPPGTGKSQTITNIIAGAVAAGKKVLFVAEKMAALDVVHRRLKAAGLGPLALELHSNKTSKRAVLDELRRTREAAPVAARDEAAIIEPLSEATATLNEFADRLHTALEPSGLTPRQILGRLIAQETGKWNGQIGADYALDGAEGWTVAAVARRRDLAQDIAARLAAIGPVPQSPWRGVGADPLDPATRDTLARDIAAAREALQASLDLTEVPSRLFGVPEAITLDDLKRALAYLQITPLPQVCDRSSLADPAWHNPKGLEDLIVKGQYLLRLRQEVHPLINEAGLAADYTAIRNDVVTKSRNLFRFLDGGYKRHIALLGSYVRDLLPKDPDARLKLIDKVIKLQAAEADFAAVQGLGSAFGSLWQGASSPWGDLDNLVRWRTSHRMRAEVWPIVAAMDEAGLREADTARQALYKVWSAFNLTFERIEDTLSLDTAAAFSDETIAGRLERLATWLGDLESLSRFIAFAARGRELAALGASQLVTDLHSGKLEANDLVPAFDGAYARVLRDSLFNEWPQLKGFDGDSLAKQVAQFRQLDRASLEQAKATIAAGHSEGRPKGAAGIGPLGVLNAELAKKRSHKPIRVLLDQAGPAIQDLKPVFMMSPLSVAQFLKPGALDFDLLVMDEASQIEPVDALGAIARVRQLAVVGDERQLPPTAFFKKLTGEDDIAEDEEGVTVQAKDVESILELCLAKGAPHRMLNWHYRSKHPSLIAVSNREFYDSRLFTVPSPYDLRAGLGLKFHLLDTVYDRGNTRTNPQEARIVAQAVMSHARTHPAQTLGVATFSVSQRQCILKELELLRRANPDTESFFAAEVPEPFFVKNLENIQGDERDIIFVSVGYGKTAQGTLSHFFGPLSQEGGERRLNVLISRAKLRCEVFANFSGADIDPERSQARGVLALKLFMTFAETGRFDAGVAEGGEAEGGFEEQLAKRLRDLGYTVGQRIGASGFRVDLALADPDQPGRYVLGIECDGAQYHASRSARDRDRLRQQVLEDHGWALHRVWSADWYLRPKEELRKIEAAYQAARSRLEPVVVAPAMTVQDLMIEADVAEPIAVKKPDTVSAADIETAILATVEENYGAARVDLVPAVARRLGFSRTGPTMKARIEAGIGMLITAGRLVERNGLLNVL